MSRWENVGLWPRCCLVLPRHIFVGVVEQQRGRLPARGPFEVVRVCTRRRARGPDRPASKCAGRIRRATVLMQRNAGSSCDGDLWLRTATASSRISAARLVRTICMPSVAASAVIASVLRVKLIVAAISRSKCLRILCLCGRTGGDKPGSLTYFAEAPHSVPPWGIGQNEPSTASEPASRLVAEVKPRSREAGRRRRRA